MVDALDFYPTNMKMQAVKDKCPCKDFQGLPVFYSLCKYHVYKHLRNMITQRSISQRLIDYMRQPY